MAAIFDGQFAIAFLKIVLSIFEILAFWQNWTCKQKICHCDLILQQIVFILIILKTKAPIMLHSKFQSNIPRGSGGKLISLVLLFLVMAAILDSQPGQIISF